MVRGAIKRPGLRRLTAFQNLGLQSSIVSVSGRVGYFLWNLGIALLTHWPRRQSAAPCAPARPIPSRSHHVFVYRVIPFILHPPESASDGS